MPSVAGLLTYLHGLWSGLRKTMTFGSYECGSQVNKINKYLEESGFDIVETIKVKYIPGSDELKNIQDSLAAKI